MKWSAFLLLYSEAEKEEVEMDEYPQDPVSRAKTLTTKVRRWMYKRAVKEFKGIQLRSQENLQKLNFTVDLVRVYQNLKFIQSNEGVIKSFIHVHVLQIK